MWSRMKWGKALLICLLLSGCIELIQLVGRIGLFEFDDIFGNTIGGLIGCGTGHCLFPVHHYTELPKKK